jgi:hypothetical protein
MVICLAALIWGDAGPAWALQSHGPPEGFYVHQMAHVLFSAALAYLFWHTRRTQDLYHSGWKYLQTFCVLLILWNILAFSGHEAQRHLVSEDIVGKNTWGEGLAFPITSVKVLYYFAKMDHLLVVPALSALVMSLRAFYKDARMEAAS